MPPHVGHSLLRFNLRLIVVPVCGDIHGQYVRGSVLFIWRYELTVVASMTS